MLRMHDHLKYPYFVAFYENRVKVGLIFLFKLNVEAVGKTALGSCSKMLRCKAREP